MPGSLEFFRAPQISHALRMGQPRAGKGVDRPHDSEIAHWNHEPKWSAEHRPGQWGSVSAFKRSRGLRPARGNVMNPAFSHERAKTSPNAQRGRGVLANG